MTFTELTKKYGGDFITCMRTSVSAFLILMPVLGLGQAKSQTSAPAIPVGTLTGNLYANDSLEIRYKVQKGWVGIIDPSEPLEIDATDPGAPINTCSKLLLTTHPVKVAKNAYPSFTQVFAVVPACFPGIEFPKSITGDGTKLDFVKTMYHAFRHSPYITANGIDIGGLELAGRLIILFDNHDTVGGVHINNEIGFVESAGYWIVWAASTDDREKMVLGKDGIQVLDRSGVVVR